MGIHIILSVRVCAAHMGEFLSQKFSKQNSRQTFLKHGWVIQTLAKNSKKWAVSAKTHHKKGYDGKLRKLARMEFRMECQPVQYKTANKSLPSRGIMCAKILIEAFAIDQIANTNINREYVQILQ